MAEARSKAWQFDRRIDLSMVVHLFLLACLIIGSWLNLQRQLVLLQRDVAMLLQCQKSFEQSLELLSAKSISYEYRLRALEKHIADEEVPGHVF